MNASLRQREVNRLLGLSPVRLRARGPMMADSATPAAGEPAADMSGAACVLILPAGCSPSALDMLGRAVQAYGPTLARAARIEVRDGRLPDVPAARAYLAFGSEQAQALGRELPAAVLAAAEVVLVDSPTTLQGDAAAKRRLWTAMRTVRRALRPRA
ncbi:hypothetical protein [Pinirhizobacter soli]|uniref:hypothetical protein n=1 Tax=Pinirhizobacter soli TaxID=2786953 RepID=UPI00202A4F77|nr:hypothetical protein [Pinirhizobacter soli]